MNLPALTAEMQHKTVTLDAITIKQINDDDTDFFEFEGLASTFGNTDLHGDVFAPGAFADSLNKKIVVLFQHNFFDAPIGKLVEIEERPEGLFVRGRLPVDDELVRGRVAPQLKTGSLDSLSVGFNILEEESIRDSDGNRTGRRILKADLMEVSVVTFPANPAAKIISFKTAMQNMGAELEQGDLSDSDRSELKIAMAGVIKAVDKGFDPATIRVNQ